MLDRSAMLPVDDDVASRRLGVGAALRRALAANTIGRQPAHRPVQRWGRPRRLRRALVARPSARLHAGRATGPRRPPGPAVVANARRARSDRCRLPPRRRRRDRPHRARPHRVAAVCPACSSAVASGGVVLANAHGCGLIEDDSLAQYWPDAAAALTGSSPRLPQLGDAARTAQLRDVPDVPRRRARSTPPSSCASTPSPARTASRSCPGATGASSHPATIRRARPRIVAKDVWVLDRRKSLPLVVTPLPQVDLARSVPTRAADALFWMGRAAERAEAIARTLRVVAARRRQDPMLMTVDEGRWSTLVAAALRVARQRRLHRSSRRTPAEPRGRPRRRRRRRHEEARPAAAHVRRRGGIGRRVPPRRHGPSADQQRRRSSTRSPAARPRWRRSTTCWTRSPRSPGCGTSRPSVARRGASATSASASNGRSSCSASCARAVPSPASREERPRRPTSPPSTCCWRRTRASSPTAVSIAATSPLAPALHLLLRDRDNPRGLATCLDRIAEHVADVGWPEGATMVRRLIVRHRRPRRRREDERQVLGDTATALAGFADEVVARWFATPVKPMLMRAGRARGDSDGDSLPGLAPHDVRVLASR